MSTGLCMLAVLAAAAATDDEVERAQRIETFWATVFEAPEPHRWDAALGLGWQVWDRAHDGAAISGFYRLAVNRSFADLFAVGLLVDFARDAQSVPGLEIANSHTFVGASGGVHRWWGRYRLRAVAEAGMLFRTAEIEGQGIPARSLLRPEAAAGGTIEASVSLLGSAALTAGAGARYHPRRLDVIAYVSLAWLFAAGAGG